MQPRAAAGAKLVIRLRSPECLPNIWPGAMVGGDLVQPRAAAGAKIVIRIPDSAIAVPRPGPSRIFRA